MCQVFVFCLNTQQKATVLVEAYFLKSSLLEIKQLSRTASVTREKILVGFGPLPICTSDLHGRISMWPILYQYITTIQWRLYIEIHTSGTFLKIENSSYKFPLTLVSSGGLQPGI